MANLSQEKRKRMLNFLNTLKEKNKGDDKTLIAIDEIENSLNEKKYGLVWEQHEEAVDVKMRTHIPVFTEDKEKEITAAPGEPYNFLLEGDNLHSLRLLEKTHKGKIDVIYIDPPYNTKNKDFTYNDKKIDDTDGFRHSKWSSFISERLQIARKLLSEEGTVFISIDDNEHAQLKLLCDSIFGEKNYITSFIRKTKSMTGDDGTGTNIQHEYLLAYAKKKTNVFLSGDKKTFVNYSNPDNDPNGIWISADPSAKSGGESTYFSIKNPYTGKEDFPPEGRFWAFSQSTMEQYIKSGRIKFKKECDNSKRGFIFKRYAKFMGDKHMPVGSLAFIESNYMNSVATTELKKIMGSSTFSYPKPSIFIKEIIKCASKRSSTILDFFAGSGTTAQAVLELNMEDDGNRKFILCTNNENNICEQITYTRIKRVITGYDFNGKENHPLFRRKITIDELKKADKLLDDIRDITMKNREIYDDIKTSIKNGIITVIGSKKYKGIKKGIPANLKYYRTDFVAKDEEFLSDALLKHIAEMIQLEHGIKLDGKQYIMVMSDEEADKLAAHWEEYPEVKALYVSKDVLLTTEQKQLFKNVEIYVIPDYYFDFELQEVGESW